MLFRSIKLASLPIVIGEGLLFVDSDIKCPGSSGVERVLGKDEVTGSIPVSGSI